MNRWKLGRIAQMMFKKGKHFLRKIFKKKQFTKRFSASETLNIREMVIRFELGILGHYIFINFYRCPMHIFPVGDNNNYDNNNYDNNK
jgi:hypothetical protein